MRISKIILSIALLGLPLAAQATDQNKYYIALTGEYIATARAKGDLKVSNLSLPASIDFNNGVGGLVSLGYYASNEIRTEIEVGYRELKEKRQSITVSSTTYTANSNSKDKALSGMGNIYYDIPTGSNLTPYLGAGIGWTHATSNGSSDAFAYQGMVGLNYKVSNESTIFGGYRYFGTSNFDSTYSVSGLGMVQESFKISSSSIDIGYRYSF